MRYLGKVSPGLVKLLEYRRSDFPHDFTAGLSVAAVALPVGVAYARSQHPLDWVDIRLEYRVNLSNRNVFSNSAAAVPITQADKTSQQVTLQFVVNF